MEALSQIELIQNNSLSSLAHVEIERLILGGELEPGERIGEAEIAARIGVSRGPVREAFRALEEQGLVRIEKNRGVFVCMISAQEADEAFIARAALEGHAAALVAGQRDDEQLTHLHEILTVMKRAQTNSDVGAYAAANVELHNALIAFTGNATLQDLYDRVIVTLRLFRRITLYRSETLDRSLSEHKAIVDAIAAGDAERARNAVISHINASRERMHATQDKKSQK